MVMSESWAASLLHDVRRQRVMTRAGKLAWLGLIVGIGLLITASQGVEWAWLPALGEELVGTSLVFIFVIVLIRQFMRDATAKDFQALRTKRFDQMTKRAELFRDLCFDPSKLDKDLAWRTSLVQLYRPTPRMLRATPAEIAAYLDRWKVVSVPEDNCWFCVFSAGGNSPREQAKPDTDDQPITFSLWQIGNEALSGVFIQTDMLNALIGRENTEALIDRMKDLFVVPKDQRPEAKRRHATALIEVRRQAPGLLLDLPMWDLISSEAAHIISHVSIDVFEYLGGASAGDRSAPMPPASPGDSTH